MLMIQRPLDVVDSSIGHSTPLKYLQPLLGGLLLRVVLDQPVDFRSVLDTIAVGDEASIGLPLGESKSITQNTKQLVVPTTKQNVTVKGFVTSVGHYRGCTVKSVHLVIAQHAWEPGNMETYDVLCPSVRNPSVR